MGYISRHLAAVAHQPFAKPRRKRRHPFAAQVAASPLPIKHLHLVQAARLIALEPRPYPVVVEIERFRDLGTVPAIIQQQNRVRPGATPWVSLGCRITACKAVRSLALGNPPRSMAKEESTQERIARTLLGLPKRQGITYDCPSPRNRDSFGCYHLTRHTADDLTFCIGRYHVTWRWQSPNGYRSSRASR